MLHPRQGTGLKARLVLGALGVAVAVAWTGPAAAAAAGPWSETEYGAVRLVSATEAVGDASQMRIGAEFRMTKGWKIYWRSPGDAGFPPSFDWSSSGNLADAAVLWPLPERFSAAGFETVGYSGEVILPIDATLARPGEAAAVRARLEYLTCDEICVPVESELTLALPTGPAAPSEHAHRIARFAARVPGQGAGVTVESVALRDGQSPRLVVTATSDEAFRSPDVLVEGPRELAFSRPQVALLDGGRRAMLAVPVDGLADLGRPLLGEPVTVTLFDGERAVEATATVAAAGVATDAPGRSLAAILGLALLGGLILNLMPCVLPVLSIKLLGVIRQGGRSGAEVRAGFLASAAGILFSFLLLAAALIGLKLAGAAVGWGIQFQQPWFIIAMTVIVVAFACNLWGFFEIRAPGWADALAGPASRSGLAGHFASGAFATLLATPCTAPFLGTAVGFALARGPGEIAAVFAALGTGLALPYLAVAAMPRLASRLPRPGPWMATLQRVLGAALIATAAWLLSVLAAQSGTAVALVASTLVGAMAAALLLRRRVAERFRAAATTTAIVSMVAAFAAPAVQGAAQPAEADLEGIWRPFEEAAIPALVERGNLVFVDVTAAWCITCRVNKKVAFSDDVRERLGADDVVAMRADWTRPEPTISRYLARYGRYGIPFNIVYGPGAPDGLPLPELLTPAAVRSALELASRRPS